MIASNIRYLRKKHKLSQNEFAEQFGITRGMIDSYEGNRASPSPQLLREIAKQYKLTVEILLREDLRNENFSLIGESNISMSKEVKDDIISLKDELIAHLKDRVKEQEKIINFLFEKMEWQKRGNIDGDCVSAKNHPEPNPEVNHLNNNKT